MILEQGRRTSLYSLGRTLTFLELSINQTDSKPGIYVIKSIGDDDNPTTITGTLITS